MSDSPSASAFDMISGLGAKTRVVRVASPEDIVRHEKSWPEEEMKKPEEERKGMRVKLHVKPDATFTDFTIRSLTLAQRAAAERIVDSIMPPPLMVEQPSTQPGQPPRRVPSGYDEENPEYLAKRRSALAEQAAFIVVCGVVGMQESIEGNTNEQKALELMKKAPAVIIDFLSSEIYHCTFAAGDLADFFTSAPSSNVPS